VIPAEFDYAAPDSVDEAIRLLAEGGEDAKLLAGGHSLLPLMKVRLAAPTMLVDLKNVPGLRGVESEDSELRIGAMTSHAELADARAGLLAQAAGLIADQQVRNRGTVGGSFAHGDPASDLPAILLAAEGGVSVKGSGGEREVPAAELFQDYLTTSLAPDEVITSVRAPKLSGYGYGYRKFTRRAEDWAMVAVSALVKVSDGACEDVRVGLTHMGSTPLRASATEDALRGQPLDAERIAQAADQAAEGTDPPGDLNATPDYKRHLARVLCRRALEEATAGTG
jgi:aerobic carbon-monoxide dehydrogenase medium subunit